jgi:hypothetical protein
MAAGGAAVATVAAASRDRAQDGAQFLHREFKALNDRLDKVDESHKRLFRALVVVASVSTGMDVLTLLKGDLLS